MSHTPGPWIVADDNRCIMAGNDCVVCMGHDYDDGGSIGARYSVILPIGEPDRRKAYDDEAAANERLICAAPDLLAALKDVQDWLLETGQLEDDGITHPLMLKANNRAVAAIAKAEGR